MYRFAQIADLKILIGMGIIILIPEDINHLHVLIVALMVEPDIRI